MKAEEIKVELIAWIASLQKREWLSQLLEIKKQLETKTTSNQPDRPSNRVLRGYGKYAGQIKLADDFDEPLEDFKDYM